MIKTTHVFPYTLQIRTVISGCPCNVDCPNGCIDCSNPICGNKQAILVLSTNWIGNLPMVIGFNGCFHSQWQPNKVHLGEVDLDINFTYDINTEVVDSCAASLHGEMWVLGGYNQKRQVRIGEGTSWILGYLEFQLSKITDCRLTNVGELPFEYDRGGCNTFSFGIMLCFSKYATQECYS